MAAERASLARQIIEGKLDRLEAKGEVQIVDGDPSTEILRLVELLPAELLVVGTRGRSGVTSVMLGSVAANMVHSAPCSVLGVRLAAS
jgi:nucleotide-binding universal stress UspA family protein